jgi:predicted LPLAT superfamily acyltransferase
VYTLFCLNENGTHHIYFEFFSEHLRLPRNTRSEALAACVQGYADRLERYTKQAPLQWFNFYDFWYNPEG